MGKHSTGGWMLVVPCLVTLCPCHYRKKKTKKKYHNKPKSLLKTWTQGPSPKYIPWLYKWSPPGWWLWLGMLEFKAHFGFDWKGRTVQRLRNKPFCRRFKFMFCFSHRSLLQAWLMLWVSSNHETTWFSGQNLHYSTFAQDFQTPD